jgi:hypothetical protein
MAENKKRNIAQAILDKRKLMADGGDVTPEAKFTNVRKATPEEQMEAATFAPGTPNVYKTAIDQPRPVRQAPVQPRIPEQAPGGAEETISPLDFPMEAGALAAKGASAIARGVGRKAAQEAAPEMLELYHYSPKKGIEEIDPKFAGTGFDARARGRNMENKVMNYYHDDIVGPGDKNLVDQAPFKYKTEVEANKVYDITNDPQGIIARAQQKYPGFQGSQLLDQAIPEMKAAGYEGYRAPGHAANPNQVALFVKKPATPVTEAANLSKFKSSSRVRNVADQYAKDNGIKLEHSTHEYEVDPERGARIAAEYEKMKHAPNDPAVKKAYDALANETINQFKALEKSGLKVTKMTEGMENPYPNGSRDVLADIEKNNHLYYFPSEQGFGSEAAAADNPLLRPSGVKVNGEELPVNDLFRIVHDYFGHAKEGTSFGPKGEENAWVEHMKMFSPEAQKALTTETRGQNSWVNFGPQGEANRANPAKTVFAPQKTGLLPDWVLKEMPKKGKPKYAEGGVVQGYADGGGPVDIQNDPSMDPRLYGIKMPEPEQQMPEAKMPQSVNVFNPNGDLVSIPAHQLNDALQSGYTEATDQDLEKHLAEQEYGGVGQTAIAGLEGLGRGLAGPLATASELALGLTTPEAIRGRELASPTAAYTGEIAGLIGGGLLGTGEARVAEMGAHAVGKAIFEHEAPSLVSKIGSAAVKGAVENSIIQSGNEVHKMIIQDPEQSVGSAAINIGLSGVVGGALGTAVGSAKPLWDATVGNKVGQILGKISNRAGGIENVMSSDMNQALEKAGIEIEPEIRAALSDDRMAQEAFSTLNQSDTTKSGLKLQEIVKNFRTKIQHAMVDSLGLTPEKLATMSEVNRYEAGKKIGNILANEYTLHLDPVVAEFDDLKSRFKDADIIPSIASKADKSAKLLDRARIDLNKANKGLADALENQDVAKAIEMSNTVKDLQAKVKDIQTSAKAPGTADTIAEQLGRLVDKEAWYYQPEIMKEVNNTIKHASGIKSIKDIADLATAVGNNTASTLPFGQQTPLSRAGQMIKNVLREAESDAAEARLGQEAPELVERYKLARAKYAEASKLKDALDDRLGTRASTSGFGKAIKNMAVTDGEGIARRLSGKNDADLLNLIQSRFPATAQAIREMHLGTIVEKGLGKAKEGELISSSNLMKAVNDMDPNLRKFALNPQAQTRLDALHTLLNKLNEVPNTNFSNTARVTDKLMAYLPGSATAMAAMLTGHGAGAALLAGPLVKILAKDAPDAVRLSMLKWLGTGKEIQPGAFKSMVDYVQAVQKGQAQLNSSVKSVFKAGKAVLPQALMPSEKDISKLDKQVKAYKTDPSQILTAGQEQSHYMPEHAQSIGQIASTAMNYLNSLRPDDGRQGPLDNKPVINSVQKAQYERALSIAQQPLLILDKIQKGTLVPQDIMTLRTIYPGLYNKLNTQLMTQMTEIMDKGHIIPYQTRIGLSMFMAQPLDSTMKPTSIMSAQMVNKPQPQPAQGANPPSESSTKGIQKMPSSYMTPSQAREKERSAGK